jgi:alpha-L-rhamnosidase
MIKVDKIRVQYHSLQKDARYRITDAERPAFSWSVCSDTANDRQEACRVRCFGDDGRLLWDSEWREQNAQELICDVALPKEERITVAVAVRGRAEKSEDKREHFYVSALSDYTPRWIARADEEKERVQYFRRELSIEKPLKRATVYVSGIGLHELEINGTRPDESYLDPIVSNYKKCTYISKCLIYTCFFMQYCCLINIICIFCKNVFYKILLKICKMHKFILVIFVNLLYNLIKVNICLMFGQMVNYSY